MGLNSTGSIVPQYGAPAATISIKPQRSEPPISVGLRLIKRLSRGDLAGFGRGRAMGSAVIMVPIHKAGEGVFPQAERSSTRINGVTIYRG
jgi:hypothetical protein